jgi:hypothetical protein
LQIIKALNLLAPPYWHWKKKQLHVKDTDLVMRPSMQQDSPNCE